MHKALDLCPAGKFSHKRLAFFMSLPCLLEQIHSRKLELVTVVVEPVMVELWDRGWGGGSLHQGGERRGAVRV